MNMIQTIENKIHEYNPNEFMPVFEDGQLVNRNQFYAYKAGQVARGIGHFVYRTVEVTVDAVDQLVQAANQ